MVEPARRVDRLPSTNVRAIFLAKSAALSVVLAFQWALKWFVAADIRAGSESLVILLALVPNLAVAFWRGEVPARLLALTFAADVLALSVGVHFSGGVDQTAGTLLYPLVITLAGLLLSARAAFLAAAGSAVGYAFVAWAEYRGWLPHLVPFGRPPQAQLATVLSLSLMLFLFAWLVSYAVHLLHDLYARAELVLRRAVRTLSNDLEQPLRSIHDATASRGSGAATIQGTVLRCIRANGQEALDVVFGVLDAARFERGNVVASREPLYLRDELADQVDIYGCAAAEAGVRLECGDTRGIPPLEVDAPLFRRALGSLLSYALQSTPRGGLVALGAEVVDGAAEIRVRDGGSAVPPKIGTSPFVVSGWSVPGEAPESMDLRLYVARETARAHGGSLEIARREEGGRDLVLRIPTTGAEAPRTMRASRRPAVGRMPDRLPDANVREVYRMVAIALAGLIAFVWGLRAFLNPEHPAVAISLTSGLSLVPTLAVLRWPRPVPVWLLVASLASMLLSVTAGVHFGGGVNNVSNIQLYAALIGLAGLLLAEHAALAMSAAAAVAYATLVWAESRGLLWTLLPGMRPVDRQIATVIMVALCLVMFAGLVFYAVRQIRVVYGRVEELRREAVRALSHDLKNPLMVIRGYAYLMSDADPAERAEYLMRIQHAAQQALDMVHNVLDASNLEERMFVPSRSRADLNGLVAEAVEAYRPAAQARGVRLSVSLGKDIPDMEIDVHLVGRAVANLVSNGIKYSDRGGVVTVATYREGDRVAIEARDTGHGIPQEEQDGIFRQYSRILSATHSVEGTGLGLHIVRCVAEAHGGSVAVDSTPGLGSTFTLWLPLLPA